MGVGGWLVGYGQQVARERPRAAGAWSDWVWQNGDALGSFEGLKPQLTHPRHFTRPRAVRLYHPTATHRPASRRQRAPPCFLHRHQLVELRRIVLYIVCRMLYVVRCTSYAEFCML